MKRVSKTSGFKIPENYFEDFEERLFSGIEAEKFPRNPGMRVPENYFSEIENTILGKVNGSKKSGVRSLFQPVYFGYAAAVAVLLVIGLMFVKSDSETNIFDSIQIGVIERYIEEGNLNMDLYDLTSYLHSETIPEIDFGNHQFSEPVLEKYLFENTDLGILLEQEYIVTVPD